MTKTSLHNFEPVATSPVSSATVDLEVSNIEDAGLRDVLQTSGRGSPVWGDLPGYSHLRTHPAFNFF